MARTKKSKVSTSLPRICKLLPKIHTRVLKVILHNNKEVNQRQVRWAELLASYDFQIHYRKGSENGQADALSQRSDLTTEKTQERSLFTGKEKTPVLDKPEVATLHQDNAPKQRHIPEKD